ncbi:transcriptional regulator [Thalassobacillus devorans]|uniref:Transcriptional regulator n=1 Tax=Thalassobacillus devorans TaxID=279813 RepID=A0ABQ1PSK1_9BACI|nr:metalloregulator ArsR/SmtB family transcription factor [Thalassobacillus devorans]NIK30638.1 ArsR family transcriptional regulator [Thalassobacillus devorans]GGD02595.1 transcriptional regulator [Thalassobacillus devorans]
MEKTMVDIERATTALKLLGDKTRLTIVGLLKGNECCVCEFVEILQMSQPAISQHLRKLRDAGLVQEERKGHWIFYKLNESSDIFPLVANVLEHIPEQKEKLEALEKSGKRIQCD